MTQPNTSVLDAILHGENRLRGKELLVNMERRT